MAVDSLSVWKQELKNLPYSDNPTWATNFANWYFDRVSAAGAADGKGLEPDPSVVVPTGWVFTFNVAVFIANLMVLPPTPDPIVGVTGFATAWETAMLASTAVAASGTYVVPAADATTFSAVATTVFDPPSILAAKAKILELVTAPPAADADDSEFPEKFRDATLLLTVTITGTNSVSPTTGPLVAPLTPLV